MGSGIPAIVSLEKFFSKKFDILIIFGEYGKILYKVSNRNYCKEMIQ